MLLAPEAQGSAADIVLRVRLPRVVLSLLVGASLSVAGVLFQALLRNPLADPFVLGVSGGAALGGIAVLSLGSSVGLSHAAVPPAAFAGAVATTLLLGLVSGARGRASATSLLLTGVVFNAFASAGIVFLASFAGLTEGAGVFLWLIGSLSTVRADIAGWVALFLFAGLACALPLARSLNLLALGEEPAQQLGVDVARVQRVLLVAASLMVGAAVSVAGLVGFVGPDHSAPAAPVDRSRSPAAGARVGARRGRLPAALRHGRAHAARRARAAGRRAHLARRRAGLPVAAAPPPAADLRAVSAGRPSSPSRA